MPSNEQPLMLPSHQATFSRYGYLCQLVTLTRQVERWGMILGPDNEENQRRSITEL
jgi:hypothetical protein